MCVCVCSFIIELCRASGRVAQSCFITEDRELRESACEKSSARGSKKNIDSIVALAELYTELLLFLRVTVISIVIFKF